LCSDNFKASHLKSGCKKLYVVLFKFIKVDAMAFGSVEEQNTLSSVLEVTSSHLGEMKTNLGVEFKLDWFSDASNSH
jgi:hypothetical protein